MAIIIRPDLLALKLGFVKYFQQRVEETATEYILVEFIKYAY
jgi:hypothetical protein